MSRIVNTDYQINLLDFTGVARALNGLDTTLVVQEINDRISSNIELKDSHEISVEDFIKILDELETYEE